MRPAVPISFTVEGNLGADGGGDYVHTDFQSGVFTGYMTSVCPAHPMRFDI